MHELLGHVSKSALALRVPDSKRQNSVNPNIDRIIHSRIDLPEPIESEIPSQKAELLHQQYAKNSVEREASLQEIYQQLGRPDDLIIMICCNKFAPLLALWLLSCDQNNIDVRDKTIVFTLDLEAHKKAIEIGLQSYLLDPQHYYAAGGSVNFGDGIFMETMFYKNAVIVDALKLGANILFQDVDLIWLRDPLAYLKVENLTSDIQIMHDGVNPRHYPYYANTGFFYLRNTNVTKAVFETAMHNTTAIFKTGGHQPALNRILHHFAMYNLLDLTVLAENLFLNGHLFNLKRGTNPKANYWQTDGFVIHYSWTGNYQQKIDKLKMFNFFNIDVDI